MSVDTTVLERTIIFDKLDEIDELCRTYTVQRLELFGSALRHDIAPDRSDIDFLVEYRQHTPEAHYENFFGFLEALQTIFGRDIDLVEASAIENPYFREAVESTMVLLYVATQTAALVGRFPAGMPGNPRVRCWQESTRL